MEAAADGDDPFTGDAVWLDVGTGDPFHSADTDLAASLRDDGTRLTFHSWPGGHNSVC